jgi:hypothetical protein
MAILSPMKGIDNWLKSNKYISSKANNAASFIKEYQESTGNKMNLKPNYSNRDTSTQHKEFLDFINWVKQNKQKLS